MALSDNEKKLLQNLSKISIENKSAIDIITKILTMQNICLYSIMKFCESENCNSKATVYNSYVNVTLCDSCAARAIVNATKSITGELDDQFDLVRQAIARQESWEDLENAEAIRFIELHNKMIYSFYDKPDLLQ